MVAAKMEIIVGTYEEMLVGYELTQKEGVYSLKQSFTNHSHMGSIRCLCATSKFLTSGATDETINLFNLKNRTECGALIHHEGSINALKFYGNSYLLSASEDGNICVWQTNNWQCLKTLRGHKKGVTSLSVHPSGKLALSLSKDATLRTWNLVKGRSAYIINLKKVADIVEWSTSGHFYAVAIDENVDIYSVEKAGIIRSIDYGRKIHCLSFVNDDVILIGGESGSVEIHSTLKDKLYCKFNAHSTRIKEMKIVEGGKLVTASNDGYIKVWQFDVGKMEDKPNLLVKTNTGCRITCLTVAVDEVKMEIEEIKEEESIVETESVKRPKKDETKMRKKKKIAQT
uniref:Uncharacterized protein n=1 Tax=Strigamia maritima TaxID=126957 RepID=T1IW39_STRMM